MARNINQEIYDHLLVCDSCNRPHYEVLVGKQFDQRSILLFADSDVDAIQIACERSGEERAEIVSVYSSERRLSDAAARCH